MRRTGAPGAGAGAQFGAVTFLHRFGSSLNPHVHYHLCVLDTSVRIAAHDRVGLERLIRYCARPLFALERLEERRSGDECSGEGVALYHLPRPAHDGRTVVRLTPLELLDRLAILPPPPRTSTDTATTACWPRTLGSTVR